jgi:hypothetical protein
MTTRKMAPIDPMLASPASVQRWTERPNGVENTPTTSDPAAYKLPDATRARLSADKLKTEERVARETKEAKEAGLKEGISWAETKATHAELVELSEHSRDKGSGRLPSRILLVPCGGRCAAGDEQHWSYVMNMDTNKQLAYIQGFVDGAMLVYDAIKNE